MNSKTRVRPGAKLRSAFPERTVGLMVRLLCAASIESRFDCSSVRGTLCRSVPSLQISGDSPLELLRSVIGFSEVSKSIFISSMTTGVEFSDASEVTLSCARHGSPTLAVSCSKAKVVTRKECTSCCRKTTAGLPFIFSTASSAFVMSKPESSAGGNAVHGQRVQNSMVCI